MKQAQSYWMLALCMLCICACGPEKKEDPKILTTVGHFTSSDPDVVISTEIPLGITSTGNPVTLESLQHDFDVFSWKTFVALNWPATADGTPRKDVKFGDQQESLTVWQAWKSSREIFLPNGEKPNAWGEVENVPIVCEGLTKEDLEKGIITLTQVGKTPNVLDESGEPFQTGPLIDQNGQYTRYEILTNKSMFEYIVDNDLYNQQGQEAFKKEEPFMSRGADFPFSAIKDSVNSAPPNSPKVGAIMVKASWIKMEGKYDESKFHTAYALVYDNPHEQAGVKPACELVKVGLVGFHIAHKTETDPQWVWSTFEHVDNVPTQGEPATKDFYNFWNKDSKYPVNEPPARPWNPATPHSTPSQVERVIPIDDDAKKLNKKYQDAFRSIVKNSVWANYELVSTQWPTDAKNVSDPTGKPAPTFLANTTLETYIQGRTPQTSSSCIACHNNASTTAGTFSDFTYLLQRAEKKK
jgi:hypothetical protein